MASIDQIQTLLVKENSKLKQDLSSEIMKQVGVLLDSRLEAHEAKLMAEIRLLQKRTEALESKGPRLEGGMATGAATAKRARSEPRNVVQRHELKPVVVLTGFPPNSRKKELEEFTKTQLEQKDEWKHLVPFAPNVRSSTVMIKVSSRDEVFDFIRHWKNFDVKFKENPIRARGDKPPEQRKANSKIYKVSEYMRKKFADKDVDADFKHSSVWVGDWEVVKWDSSSEKFVWDEDNLEKAGVTIDQAEVDNL